MSTNEATLLKLARMLRELEEMRGPIDAAEKAAQEKHQAAVEHLQAMKRPSVKAIIARDDAHIAHDSAKYSARHFYDALHGVRQLASSLQVASAPVIG